MSRGEWVIQLAKLVFAAYFVWWSLAALTGLQNLALIELAGLNLLK